MIGIPQTNSGSIAGGVSGLNGPSLRESEINMEVDALDREISATFESAQKLSERLRAVCNANMPPVSCEAEKPGQPMSPLADTLHCQRNSLRQSRDQLDWILAALAL